MRERCACACVNESVRACICVGGWVSERESVCVCATERVCVCVCVWEWAKVSVRVCVCERDEQREREGVCERVCV